MRALKQVLNAKGSNWAICLLSGSLMAVAASTWMRPGPVSAQAGAAPRPRMSGESKAVLNAMQDAFVNIAETVEPTVVTVSARSNPAERNASPMQDRGDSDVPEPFKDFFRRLPRPDGPDEGMRGTSTGSGVIIRETGNTVYVLTNNHVVDNRAKYRVSLYDKSEYNADLVGIDGRTDLAVLKFQVRKPLPAGSIARLGDSDEVRVGEWAIAIGSPLGYESTLTVGVISAKGRALDGVGQRNAANYVDLLQTDASINPGNSGGPLVNLNGEVVGINVAIASSGMSQGNIGIGFAIPVNNAKTVAEQLMDKGKVTRGFLGVQVSSQNRELCVELKEQLKCYDGGALVETVSPNAPAGRAGVKEGDVIVKFGPHPVRSFTDLEKAVAVTRPGDSVPVEVVREGQAVRLSITVMERPSEEDLDKQARAQLPPQTGGSREGSREPQGQPGTRSKFGLSLRAPKSGRGVEVASVATGSPAWEAGLRAGDVIVQVGNAPVQNIDSFQKTLDAASASTGIVMKVETIAGMRYVVVRP